MNTDRRTFLSAAAAAVAVTPSLDAARYFAHPIGLSLYTVRAPLAKAPAATYEALGKMGIKLLEVRPVNLQQHAPMMQEAGLKPVHMFIETAIITGAWEEWAEFMRAATAKLKLPAPPPSPRARLEDMIDLAAQHGVKRIGTSMLLPGERTAAGIEAINKAAEQCEAGGIELYYHNHGFEFAGPRGSRFLDQLKKNLDARVRLELDVFWAALGGEDPAALLKQWKGRVRSIHLKDIAPDAPRGAQELDVPPSAFRELGAGQLDFKKIVNAAEDVGVEYYFVELDHAPSGDAVLSVRNCVQYLKQLSL